MAKKSKKEGKNLIEVCLEDEEFATLFETLTPYKQAILNGELENYIGTSLERAEINIAYSKSVISKEVGDILKIGKLI